VLIDNTEQFFGATGAVIRHGGDIAYYAPGRHPAARARGVSRRRDLAPTKAHELTHWTKHPRPLARDFRRQTLRRHGLRR
jgi:antirestriction protein ArdC